MASPAPPRDGDRSVNEKEGRRGGDEHGERRSVNSERGWAGRAWKEFYFISLL